jgi:hypothetical protein
VVLANLNMSATCLIATVVEDVGIVPLTVSFYDLLWQLSITITKQRATHCTPHMLCHTYKAV